MKTRFHRFSSGWSFARLLSISVFVLVAIGAPGLLSAQPPLFTSGSTGITYKTIFNDRDLFCDLNDLRSTAIITWDLSVTPPTFRFGAAPAGNPLTSISSANPAEGSLWCYETDHTTGLPIPNQAGLFTLIQVRSENGLVVDVCNQGDSSCADGGLPPVGAVTKRTTFIYSIKSGGQNNENLLYRLIPATLDARGKFCLDSANNPIPDQFCGANIGLDEHNTGTFTSFYYDGGGNGEKASDYPARDLSLPPDGVNDLANGEVFRFTIETENGIVKPRGFPWGPCHNGQFDLRVAVACQFKINSVVKATTVKGDVEGVLIVPIDLQADNATNSSLNMGQTSGTYPVAIVGTLALPVSNFAVATGSNSLVFVDGTQVPIVRFSVADVTSPGQQGVTDSIPDLVIYFDKASFARAVLNFITSTGRTCTNGSRETVTLNGTLTDGTTQWQGTDSVTLTNCP